jgi:hypothetical protein
MSPRLLDTQAIEFFILGFRRALLRYRRFVLIGWGITMLGSAGLPGSCGAMDRGDLLTVGIPMVTMFAGILTVHQGITALQSYVMTPFPLPEAGELEEPLMKTIAACNDLMHEVAEGGWREAFEAIGAMDTFADPWTEGARGMKS